MGRRPGRITRINPVHWIYLLAHGLVFVIGVVLAILPETHFLPRALVQAVGVAMIAAGLAGWMLFVYVVIARDAAEQLALFSRAGFVSAFESRSAAIKTEYDRRLSSAKSNIDILGFGLATLREDYGTDFKDWARKAKVRILLIDSEYPSKNDSYAEQRDREEANPTGDTGRDVEEFARVVASVIRSSGDRFKVRLYRCLPSVNMFRIDDEIFWGPYFLKVQSRNTPTFIVRRDGFMYPRLLAHFEAIWDSDEFSRPMLLS
jgi:hypothetical protein